MIIETLLFVIVIEMAALLALTLESRATIKRMQEEVEQHHHS